MAFVNHLGDVKREYHHVKCVVGNGEERYEPAMVLLKENLMGRSFMIPLPSLWKYLDPKDNIDARAYDAHEFDKMAEKIYFKRQMRVEPMATAMDCAAIVIAEQMNEDCGLMLCTAYSLVKCCQLLEISVNNQSLAQLLMFIQDGLDQLKAMPMHERENVAECGEAIITVNGEKFHREISLSESELLAGGE